MPVRRPDDLDQTELTAWTRPHPLTIAARALLLVLTGALSLAATHDLYVLLWSALLATAGVPAVLAPHRRVVGPLARLAEAITVGFAASDVAARAVDRMGEASAGAAAGAMLPYLVVPVVSATLLRRPIDAGGLLAVGAATVLGAGAAGGQLTDSYLTATGEWLTLAALGGAVAALLQRTLLIRADQPAPYAEATRLLTQLRSVARQLPGANLDPGGLAEHLLDEVREIASADRAVVLTAGGGRRLVVLAQRGSQRVDWETALDADSAIADAWTTQQTQISTRSQARSQPGGDVSALVVPLVAGVRTIGLVTIESDSVAAYSPGIVARVAAVAAPSALRLEAALLFDEVRALATNEERQRLAREIHDGVAQELVIVGYGIDNALSALPSDVEAAQDDLRTLRAEVTRVITELRLSLFELRSEVDRHGGLGAAIAEYARAVATSAGLRVHMSLDESSARLPAATEAELLRIAQEAITNARKHSGAENLWVTCALDPPFAQISVSDDGKGIADSRPEGHYGLAIMAERAERIRGRLEIMPRTPTGTTVAVVLGTSTRRGSVGGTAEVESSRK